MDSILRIARGKMFHESQSCVRRFAPHILSVRHVQTNTSTYDRTYTNLDGTHPSYCETTERALIDSLGLFSIKKIPFGLEESLRGENRNKEREKVGRCG